MLVWNAWGPARQNGAARQVLVEGIRMPHSTKPLPAQAGTADEAEVIPSFAEMVSALSFAMDLTEGAVPGHAVRSCILGMRIGCESGLSEAQLASLFYALLMKDAGCSNNAARMCQIVGGDDRAVKNGVKLVDWSRPEKPSLESLRLLWREVLPTRRWLRRALRILRIGVTQHRNNAEMIGLRCERGAQITRKLGLSTETAEAVRLLDEHWDGSGYPEKLRAEAIPMLARIVAVAQHLDIFACEKSPEIALQVLAERSGTWFDPKLVKVTLRMARKGKLWRDSLCTDDADAARQIVLKLEPTPGNGVRTGAEPAEIDQICEAFADVVDAKSPFTYRHSMGVAEVAVQIAETLELPPERRRLVWRAALLHDLGKLAVPNTILDKPGRLTAEEFAVVAEHPRISREILERIGSFAELAEIAGSHHERLDGTGYPKRLKDAELSLEAKLIAVADFYQALVEDRPYRAGMPHEKAMVILRSEALDPQCVNAVDWVRRKNPGHESAEVPSDPFINPLHVANWMAQEVAL